jgi:hypothetical protein
MKRWYKQHSGLLDRKSHSKKVQYAYWKLTTDNHMGNADIALWIRENHFPHRNIRECGTAKRRNHKNA